MTDGTLVAEAKNGRQEAFEILCERASRQILRTTYRITQNREDAEDARQDAFLKAFVHLKSFDGRSSFSTWLTRIAINSALMALRKKRTCREISMENFADRNETNLAWEIPDHGPSPEKRFEEQERERLLWDAIGQLRPSVRKVVEFQLAQDCPMRKTAGKIGISVCAAKSRLFHAKAAIRKSLRPRTIGGAPVLRPAPAFADGKAAYRKNRSVEMI
jgi:RNA polymerase sigma factor (sigma-70 family)